MIVLRNRAKRALAAALLAALVVLLVAVLVAAARLQQRAGEGADPAAALTEVPDGASGLEGIVSWAPDGPLQERAVERPTRRALEAAWTRSWEALQHAAAGDPSHLDTWFVGGALEQVRGTHALAGGPSALEIDPHVLRVVFYSDDGSIIGLEADPVRVTREIQVDGTARRLGTEERIEAILTLEDGNWRIRQWVRRDIEIVSTRS